MPGEAKPESSCQNQRERTGEKDGRRRGVLEELDPNMDGTIDEIGVSQASLRGKVGRDKEEAGQEKKHRIAWGVPG